ncbi:cilia- and flagella-associated protein 58 [Anopheles ziemanni]|uniref:cilia- and flagella-associated protein 58 n=1 Tax=Anopheles coustani TaxID=139045 RepID=UPI0026581A5B|nr:cilia- and flagella-associated protein 58 [Anopheles coustani]XP_058174777.1 cilia- and flagella-associated protein 58 [Anopheles ziemanni]
MAELTALPVFFDAAENLTAKERIERKRRETAEIIRWKYRILKLDAVKPSATAEAYQIRCLNKRLVPLEQEKAAKELSLKISNASVHRREAESSRRQILHLLDEVATYQSKIASATTDMNELESQINRASLELDNSSKAVTSDYNYAEALVRSHRQLEAMEDRLHHARTLEGKLHAENRKFRQHIEDMLGERKRYNMLWMEYVQQLNRNRKFLHDMTERATLAFNQGEDLCYRVEALKTQQQREARSRVQEMVELERQIVGTRRTNEFLRTKSWNRPVASLDPLLVRKRDLVKQEHLDKLHRYGAVIDHTKNSLNVETIQQVLFEIEKQQEKYMALFRYINVTNDKIEEANQLARDLELDSERLQAAERRKRCSDAQKMKRDLQQLQDRGQQTVAMEKELAHQRASLEIKLTTVEHALSLVGYSREKILLLMAGTSSIDRSRMTEDNLKMSLAAIEHRVLAMIRMAVADNEDGRDIAVESLYASQQCAECAEGQDVNQHDERIVAPVLYDQLVENVLKRSTAPEMLYRLHTLSQCKLPRSRMLVNKRYQ